MTLAKQSSLINRTEVRRRLIERAKADRYYFQSIDNLRVSELTLECLEARLDAFIRAHVAGLPSKGKTL